MRIKFLASELSDNNYIQEAKSYLASFIPEERLEYVDDNPECFYVASGGVESFFKTYIPDRSYYLIVVYKGGNSFAAALEIKAFLKKQNIGTRLIKDGEITKTFCLYDDVLTGIKRLNGKNLGLIGDQSSWLLNSNIPLDYIGDTFGVKLKKLSWESLFERYQKVDSQPLIELFQKDIKESQIADLKSASVVHTLLQNCIDEYQLHAVSVECFSLLKYMQTTGCLALSYLNQRDIVAGCEGDLANTLSMLVCKNLCDQIPWLANIHDINDNVVVLAHCTIHPKMLSNYKITTHYESGIGLAVQGTIDSSAVTLVRLDFENKKIFVAEGEVTNKTSYLNDACRTQLQVKLPEKSLTLLKESPLGNHHLVLTGNHGAKLIMLARVLNFSL